MRIEAGVAVLEGDLVLDNATRMLAEGEQAILAGTCVFDLSGVAKMDSSALSLLLALRRSGLKSAAGNALQFRNVPESLTSLARLYGIADLF
jgi:phospholipid transport system transporter-binding protein